MKTTIKSLLVCGIALLSCNKEQTTEVDDYSMIEIVIEDITEPHTLKPNSYALLEQYDFENHVEQEALFRATYISDMVINQSIEVSLGSKTETEKKNVYQDVNHRKKQIRKYYNQVQQVFVQLKEEHSDTLELKGSECFRTIAYELSILAKSKYKRKVVAVFSDLQELSNVFNSYKYDSRSLAQHKKEIIDTFENMQLLPNQLQSVEVYFFYSAEDREMSVKYKVFLDTYTELLIPRGAKVFYQSSNEFQNHSIR